MKCLLIVDVQNDFCPGGSLPVPNGDKVVPILNKYIKVFSDKNYPIFASRDWHPENTKHFNKWPKHCIQNTYGAKFHPDLKLPKDAIIISKGIDPSLDGYTAFEGISKNGESFQDLLDKMGIKEIYIGGLATDYCVKQTSLDALRRKFKVFLLLDAIKGISEKSSKESIEEIISKGAKITRFSELFL